jgi:hypothetical protein
MFGGPVYFYRNVLYHVPGGGAFKFSAAPAGILAYHNTMISEQTARDPYSNTHFRNNLFIGRDAPNRGVMTWSNATGSYSSDYNGFRPNHTARVQYSWFAPAPGQPSRRPTDADWENFATLAEFQKATGQEAHGIEVDYDIFENLAPPDPTRRHHVYHSMDLNFQLKANSKAIDAGLVLPTINDGFTGRAPDLGALELNQQTPHYGPRWITWKPFYR